MNRLNVLPFLLASLVGSVACGAPDDSVDASEGAASAAPSAVTAWTTEAQVCDTSTYANTVLKYYKERGEFKKFTSSVPKQNATKDAVTIAYAVFRAAEEKGAIVLISGRTESYAHYAELFYDLNRRGYTVYAADHRGQGYSSRLLDYKAVGDSEYDKGYVDNFGDYVTDLKKFVDTVVRPDRVGKAAGLYALAHSMGGGITTRFAEQYPGIFDGFVLSSPMHKIKAGGLAEDLARGSDNALTGQNYASGDVFNWFGGGPYKEGAPYEGNELTTSKCRYAAKRAVGTREVTTHVGSATFHWVVQSMDAGRLMIQDAGKIAEPLLLLQPAEDTIVDAVGQKAVCDGINAAKAGRCQLVTLHTPGDHPDKHNPDARHEGLIEVDGVRHRELDLLMKFISEHPAKTK